jgi:hypothetical protein
MNYDEIYMYVMDGTVYVGTKWALQNLGADKILSDVVDEAGKTLNVKLQRKKRDKLFNDGLMFVASKWLYNNYIYGMLKDAMGDMQIIRMPELRQALGIAGVMTLLKAFQGKASLKNLLDDALAIGVSQMVNMYLGDYMKMEGNTAFIQPQEQVEKPQTMAVIQSPCQTVQTAQKRVILC